MYSIRELYRVGKGPSSSHTMGPEAAAERFLSENPDADRFRVSLYGSLGATGKGHMTDVAIIETLGEERVEIVWKGDELLPLHTNGMLFEALDSEGNITKSVEVYSTGGGAITYDGISAVSKEVYDLKTMKDIQEYLEDSGLSFWEYVEQCEGKEIWEYLATIWEVMKDSMNRGLSTEGIIPGGLKIARKACSYLRKSSMYSDANSTNGLLSAYALAVSEENACGHIISTAPTCGACGSVPSVLRYAQETTGCDDFAILKALATAGIVGNLVKQNASISGAEVGCQGEVGTACSMAAAAITQLLGGTVSQIEYAAEMGMEHNLGLTCDPINGLVQIPCMERNAHAATRAQSCAHYALMSDGIHVVSFDNVVSVMKETGHALPSVYKETSLAGLATVDLKNKNKSQ